MPGKPITIVELDYEGCGLVFGFGACTAALSTDRTAKCFNTYATCGAKAAFAPVTKTLRFCEVRPDFLPDELHFPAVTGVSIFAATANIAGADESLSALGRRATVEITLQDFAYHDRALDPYQAERVSGAAQLDAVGYDPARRGSFFGRLRARWPYYYGKPLRVIQGFIGQGGALTDAVSRAFVITDISAPDQSGKVVIEASDVLHLADNDRAVAPAPSVGVLLSDMTDAATVATLTPTGAGASYPVTGRAVIGSELVDYTRAGDVLTITARGLSNTKAAAHKAGDTVQQVLRFVDARLDDVLEALLRDFAKVPASFIPKAAWAAEVTRWASQYKLSRDICQPTGVSKLVAELAQFGISIFPRLGGSEIGLKVNRPPDGDQVFTLTAVGHLASIDIEDRPKDRITEVLLFSVQIDPTKGSATPDNYSRALYTPDLEAKGPREYGDTRLKKIFCPWLDNGADGVLSAVSLRLLRRLRAAPVRAKVRAGWADASAIEIADVVQLSAPALQDASGATPPRLMQVIGRSDLKPGHEIELTLQSYDFAARYAFATENSRPSYAASSSGQRARGMYACDPATLKMSNGDEPYRAI